MDEQTLTTIANSVTKGLAYTENGGAPDLSNPQPGKSGEMKSIFQYEPSTWKKDAGEILGDPNAPLTPENETHVAQQEVLGMLKKGMTVRQIASSWNAGENEPNAYTGKFKDGSSSVGKNKDGVSYDVPSYANKVLNYAKQFYQEKSGQQLPVSNQTSMNTQPNANDHLTAILSTIKQASGGQTQPAQQPQATSRFNGLLGKTLLQGQGNPPA